MRHEARQREAGERWWRRNVHLFLSAVWQKHVHTLHTTRTTTTSRGRAGGAELRSNNWVSQHRDGNCDILLGGHTHMQIKHTANSIRVCAGYNLHSGLIIYNVSCVTSLCLPGERAAAVGDTPLGEIPRHILGPCFVSSANHWDFFTTCRTIVVSSPRPHLSCQQLLNKNSTNFTHQSLCRGVRLHMRHKPV